MNKIQENKEKLIMEKTIYTESAMSDRFKNFFNSFKNEDGEYQYVNSIDSLIQTNNIVKIDYNNLTKELQGISDKYIKPKVHIAIYRAIGEIFAGRFGRREFEIFKADDFIKFNFENSKRFNDEIFGDPYLIYWDNQGDGLFEGDEKIDNVSKQLQIENSFFTLKQSDEILLYNGKVYDNIQAEAMIKSRTESLIPQCTEHNRREVISKIKAQTYTDLKDFDKNPNEITVDNGILNLDTLDKTPHNAGNLSRVLIPTQFHKPEYEINDNTIFEDIEKNLNNTLFWKFLKSSFTINGKFQRKEFETILEIASSPIIKHQIDDKAFMMLGGGDNGKSVLLTYISSIMGESNGSNISLQDIADDKFMRANLDGKSYNIFTDLEKNELKHTGKIKAIVSGEPLEVQKKNKQGYSMVTFSKLIFSCNRFPKVFDQSQGFFRRWIIIKWERDFENDPERDETLKGKLIENEDEKSRVFSCLVYLARKLHKTGKFTHTKNWKTIQKEWNENADPIDAFDGKYIIESETHKTKRDTYKFYKKITLDKGESPLGMGQFSKAFSEYHDEDRLSNELTAGRTERVWLNIDFKEPHQTTMEETYDS